MTVSHGNLGQPIRMVVAGEASHYYARLGAMLDADPYFTVVGTADNGQQAIAQTEALTPDVLLLERALPDMDGINVTQAIAERFAQVKVILLSDQHVESEVEVALLAGARSYLPKTMTDEELKAIIQAVDQGAVQRGPGFPTPQPTAIATKALAANSGTALTTLAPPTNGNGRQTNSNLVTTTPESESSDLVPSLPAKPFDQPVVLKQSPRWSHAIVISIVACTTFAIGWAWWAKIEQSVAARGQLKPQGTVKEIQAPINGVVKDVFVEDGDTVKQGDTLLTMDSAASEAELESLKNIRRSLEQEGEFYRALMEESIGRVELERAIARLKLPRSVASLARNRVALISENRLFRVMVGDNSLRSSLNGEELERLGAATEELSTRAASARLEIEQLGKQIEQNRILLEDARTRFATEQEILAEIAPLAEEGAVARLQLIRQQQEVQSRKAEVEQLVEERQRLAFDQEQAGEQLNNTLALSRKDVFDQMAVNRKQIAEIDSQLTKIVVENAKRVAEIDSQISRTQQTLKYQALKSPVSGTVFDLQASPGFVPQPSQAEALLKIVPNDNLIAEVFITNEDIGFVRKEQRADVRIDSFPFSEFGDIEGTVESIGSDALPPDEVYQYHRFPAKVKLDQQVLEKGDRQITLQSGMSVSVNIKVREKRTVLSLFTELFTDKVESLQEVR